MNPLLVGLFAGREMAISGHENLAKWPSQNWADLLIVPFPGWVWWFLSLFWLTWILQTQAKPKRVCVLCLLGVSAESREIEE